MNTIVQGVYISYVYQTVGLLNSVVILLYFKLLVTMHIVIFAHTHDHAEEADLYGTF